MRPSSSFFDLIGLQVEDGKVNFFPSSEPFERSVTGVLAGNEYKYDKLAKYYNSNGLSSISTAYDIAEAGYSIYQAYDKMNFQRAWEKKYRDSDSKDINSKDREK